MFRAAVLLCAALLAVLAVPPSARAVDLHAITDGGELVRFDPAAAGTLRFTPLRLGPGEEPRALTWLDDLWLVVRRADGSHALRRIDPISGRVEVSSELPGAPAGAVTGASTVPGGGVVHLVGDGGEWADVEVVRALASGPVTPAEARLAGAAFAADGSEYAIDTAGDQLLRATERGVYTPVGDLGIDIDPPAGFEIDAGGGLLAAAGALYRVDLATGAVTPVEAFTGGRTFRDLALIPPPRVVAGPEPGTAGGAHVVAEGVNAAGQRDVVGLVRYGDRDPAVAVPYAFQAWGGPQGAEPGTDFVPGGATATVPAGARGVNVPVPAVDDDLVEGTEVVGLSLDGGPASAVTVRDDDAELALTSVRALETAGAVLVELTREPGLLPAVVDVATAGGTATPGADYAPVATRVVVPPNERTATVALPLLDDRVREDDETVELRLTSPGVQRAVNPRRTLRLTIVSDERAGPLGADLLVRRVRVRRVLKLPFSCTEACTLAAGLRLDRRRARRLRVPMRLGRGKAELEAAGRGTVTVRLKKRTVRRVRKVRQLGATLRLVARDADGSRRVVREDVVLRR